MDLNTYILIWVCVFGVCLGSFYNVVILRSLTGESIVLPPSKCPKCGNRLKAWHNIPILSYILLGGKCYFCKEKISIQYPIIEFITMVLFGYTYWKFGFSIATPFVMLWLSLLLIMTVTDIKEHLVDCNLAIIMALSGIVCSYFIAEISGVVSSVLGLIAGVIIFELIAKAGKFIAKMDVLGDADKYVAAALGATFGIYNLPIILVLGLFAYALLFVPVFLYDKFKSKNYGTFYWFFIFVISVVVVVLLQNYLTILLLLISSVIFLHFMFKEIDINNKRELPYVPAFSVGTLIFIMFFIQGLTYGNSILSNSIQKLLSF